MGTIDAILAFVTGLAVPGGALIASGLDSGEPFADDRSR